MKQSKAVQVGVFLEVNPLGFRVNLPVPNSNDLVLSGFFRLDTASAQALVLAMLSTPEISGQLDPQLLQDIETETRKVAEGDCEFLRAAGVTIDVN